MEETGRKVVRRIAVLWVLVTMSWIIYQVFVDISKITTEVNVAFGIAHGALTLALAYYFKPNDQGPK